MKALACLALTLSLFALPSSASAEEINGVNFQVVYRGDVLPKEATPPWKQSSAVSNWGDVEDGYWRLNTMRGSSGRNIAAHMVLTHDSGHWNGRLGADQPGTTIECSIRIVDQAPAAERAAATLYFNLQKEDGTQIPYVVNFAPDVVFMGTRSSDPNLSHPMDLTNEFSTFRVVVDEDGYADLYLNNDKHPIISGYHGSGVSKNYLILAGSNSSPYYGGISEWKYLAFTNDGAFPPASK